MVSPQARERCFTLMGIVPAQVPTAEFEGAVLQPADGLAFGLLVVQIAFYLFGKVRREKPTDADVLPGSKFTGALQRPGIERKSDVSFHARLQKN